jgi:hypothetical protein
MPDGGLAAGEHPAQLEVIGVRTVGEALDALM